MSWVSCCSMGGPWFAPVSWCPVGGPWFASVSWCPVGGPLFAPANWCPVGGPWYALVSRCSTVGPFFAYIHNTDSSHSWVSKFKLIKHKSFSLNCMLIYMQFGLYNRIQWHFHIMPVLIWRNSNPIFTELGKINNQLVETKFYCSFVSSRVNFSS